jgi:hypothetical protein
MRSLQSIRPAGLVVAGALMLASPAVAQKVDLAVFRVKQEAATLVLGTLEVQRPIGGAAPCPYKLTLNVSDARHTAAQRAVEGRARLPEREPANDRDV